MIFTGKILISVEVNANVCLSYFLKNSEVNLLDQTFAAPATSLEWKMPKSGEFISDSVVFGCTFQDPVGKKITGHVTQYVSTVLNPRMVVFGNVKYAGEMCI